MSRTYLVSADDEHNTLHFSWIVKMAPDFREPVSQALEAGFVGDVIDEQRSVGVLVELVANLTNGTTPLA